MNQVFQVTGSATVRHPKGHPYHHMIPSIISGIGCQLEGVSKRGPHAPARACCLRGVKLVSNERDIPSGLRNISVAASFSLSSAGPTRGRMTVNLAPNKWADHAALNALIEVSFP